jgi:type VI protein secretion system component VasK
LAVVALRLTRFEATPEGLFYTPNAPLGIALTTLMIGRIGYRMYEVWTIGPTLARDNTEFIRSPITLAIFGVLAGYYVAYAIGLVRWRFAVLRAKRDREASQAQQPE